MAHLESHCGFSFCFRIATVRLLCRFQNITPKLHFLTSFWCPHCVIRESEACLYRQRWGSSSEVFFWSTVHFSDSFWCSLDFTTRAQRVSNRWGQTLVEALRWSWAFSKGRIRNSKMGLNKLVGGNAFSSRTARHNKDSHDMLFSKNVKSIKTLVGCAKPLPEDLGDEILHFYPHPRAWKTRWSFGCKFSFVFSQGKWLKICHSQNFWNFQHIFQEIYYLELALGATSRN